MVGTRSCTQIRTHAQKYFIALQKPHNDAKNGGYTRKKSKMLVGTNHHIAANIKDANKGQISNYPPTGSHVVGEK
eukprot:261778-Ditylum_brightwellii.AAC.1